MERLSLDRAQDPPLWTLFPNKVSRILSLSLSTSLTRFYKLKVPALLALVLVVD